MVTNILKELSASIYPPYSLIGGYHFSGEPAASVYPEDGGGKVLWNIGYHLPQYMVS